MSILPGATRKSFAGGDLRHRTLDGHSFKLCDFRGVDLRGASLRGVSFAGCDLRDADLRDTDLSYARFSYVLTHDPEYGRTDVTGARWNGADLRGVTAERVIGWPHSLSDSGVTSS
ncbi:pentapeptide repeat-containing protein [Micromonospora tulbaghiae]|uniref:pentapeptide repeat-containing protein n=1 Tax=Micromonospora TaxID=1873 RepID=UPI003326DDDA